MQDQRIPEVSCDGAATGGGVEPSAMGAGVDGGELVERIGGIAEGGVRMVVVGAKAGAGKVSSSISEVNISTLHSTPFQEILFASLSLNLGIHKLLI